jgi:hypothetical protein
MSGGKSLFQSQGAEIDGDQRFGETRGHIPRGLVGYDAQIGRHGFFVGISLVVFEKTGCQIRIIGNDTGMDMKLLQITLKDALHLQNFACHSLAVIGLRKKGSKSHLERFLLLNEPWIRD